MKQKLAVVLGTGIAGLSLAEILNRNGYKVVIIESNEKIGGEASLATQKWFHTGWLYAALPNNAAMMGCYNALNLYNKVYGEIFPKEKLNIEIDEDGITYIESNQGWFTNERVNYIYAFNTNELSIKQKFYWPIYVNIVILKRLKNLKYTFTTLQPNNKLLQMLNFWEDDEKGFKRYKIIRSTDAKIETCKITRDLLSVLSEDTDIITNCRYELLEENNKTFIKIGNTIIKPDILIMATGKSIPKQLSNMGYKFLAKQIKSVKSPIVVFKKLLEIPDFIRFTPNVEYTINHLRFNLPDGKKISTVGSYYSFPIDDTPDINYFEELLSNRLGYSKDDLIGSYYGIKTEYTKKKDRRYNHAILKFNDNSYFALAGKYSQFPLLVHDFVQQENLNYKINNNKPKIKINESIIDDLYPQKLFKSKEGVT